MSEEKEQARGWGKVYAVCALFSALTALFAVAGAINVLADGDWRIRISGATIDLPRHWEVVIPLFVIAGIVFGLGWFFGNIYVVKDKVKRYPLRVVAGLLLVAAGIGTVWTYWVRYALEGSKMEWAIENNRMDIFKEALADNPTQPELIEGAYEAAYEDRVEMLRQLLDHDFPVDSEDPERKRCLVSACVGAGLEAVRLCLAKGSKVDNCYEGSQILGRMIEHRKKFGYTDAQLLEGARLLVEAGADPHWDSPHADSAYLISRREKLEPLIEYFSSIPKKPDQKY